MTGKKGLVLLLTVGVLTLLSLAAVALTSLAVRAREGMSMADDAAQARLLARSGVAYAGARLFQDSASPGLATAENQPEDWKYRDDPSTPFEKARNPSYARGEPYADVDKDGRYSFGVDAYKDLDGDSAFDSWSGRLRGRYGASSMTFRLKIGGSGGKLNVNGGLLDVSDSNDNGIPDCQDLGRRCIISPNGVDRWDAWTPEPGASDAEKYQAGEWMYAFSRDPNSRYFGRLFQPTAPLGDSRAGVAQQNRRLADLLTEFGWILQGTDAVSEHAGLGGVTVFATTDGRHFVSAGSHDAADAAQQQGLDAAGIRNLGEWIVRNRPPGGYRSLEQVRALLPAILRDPFGDQLSLAASKKTCFPSTAGYVRGPLTWSPVERSPVNLGQASAALLQALFQGVGMFPTITEQDTIRPEEAGRLAAWMASHRPFSNWSDFVQKLLRDQSQVFDPYPSGGKVSVVVGNAIDYAQSITNKDPFGGTAFTFVDEIVDGLFSGGSGPAQLILFKDYVSRRPIPPYPAPPPPQMGIGVGYQVDQPSMRMPYGTLELDLHPETAFSIQCLGIVAGSSGGVRASYRMEGETMLEQEIRTASQAGFENEEEAIRNGIRIVGRPDRDRTQTYPLIDLDAAPQLRNFGFRYPPFFGNIRLMDYSPGINGGETFYAPFWDTRQPMRNSPAGTTFQQTLADAAQGGQAYDYSGNFYLGAFIFNGNAVPTGFQPGITDGGGGIHPYSGGAFYGATWTDVYGDPYAGKPDSLMEQVFSRDFSPHRMNARYRWDGTGGSMERMNHRAYPLDDGHGRVSQGTVECWVHLLTLLTYRYWTGGGMLLESPGWNKTTTFPVWNASNALGWAVYGSYWKSANKYALQQRVTCMVDADKEEAQGYVNGVPDPGLHGKFDSIALDTAQPADLWIWDVDEFRISLDPYPGAVALAKALEPRYWVEGLQGRETVPSFTSPLYLFPRLTQITGAGWEGRISEEVEAATGRWNQAHPDQPRSPIRVELIAYPDFEGKGKPHIVDLVADPSGRGGWVPLASQPALKRAGSLRYRVWLDAYGESGWNRSNLSLDRFSFACKGGGNFLWLSERDSK